MTQLFIDGQEVILSEQFELELITENPYFTRKGEYTYDIDIDLRNPNNRMIYQHINRSDVTKTFKNRKAVLLSGPVEIISGIEIILSIESNIAKIQIVAGNSQLNYEGGDTNIRSLSFDSISLSSEEAIQTLFGTFPKHYSVYTSVITGVDSDNNTSVLNKVQVGEDISFSDSSNISPQYYLMYVVENLMQKLGFVKGLNELENDPVWCRTFIVNPYKDVALQELLPDWTINEFIEQVELYLNCIISIDRQSQRFDIVDMNEYFANTETAYLDDVVDDSVEKTYDVDTNYAFSYKNVSYDLPGDSYYNYVKLKDEVRKNCTVVTSEEWDDFKVDYDTYYSGPYLLHSEDFNLDYAVTSYPLSSGEQKGLIIVDRFKDAGDPDARDKSSFKIVPAIIEDNEVYSVTGGRFIYGPAVKKIRAEKSNAINDLISGSGDTEDIPDKLYIGLYYGICKGLNRGPDEYPGEYWDKMPMSSNDRYFMNKPSSNYGTQNILTLPDYSLILDGDNGLFNRVYKNKRVIDTSVEYHFRFLVNEVYELNRLFMIHNKKYYCKEMRYTVHPQGIDKVAEGVFYLAE